MSTLQKNETLKELKHKAEEGGGPEAARKQHASGKLTARERIIALFDEGSFMETDKLAETRAVDFDMQKKKVPGDGVVTGYGMINGRYVYASAQDFTVIGGSLGEMHAAKITKAQDAALKMGIPFICINDSGGARIQEGIDSLKGYGDIFFRNTIASGVIPQISVIMGPCAGGAVYSPAITDFIMMVDKSSYMCITGPDVVKAATGEEVTTEELGGAETHNTKSGVAHFRFSGDSECLEGIKKLMSFIPDNNLSDPVHFANEDPASRTSGLLDIIIPDENNKAYDMKEVIKEIADNHDFLEVHSGYALNMIVGFVRMDGSTVGIVANQPRYMAGVLDVNTSDKAARFVRFCDAFNIPLVTFTDVPGYLPGVGQEHSGVIRHGAKLLYAFAEATVPRINIITRKAYGGAYIAMNSRHLGADFVFAWPTAEIAVMGAEGAANVIFRREISAAADPAAARTQKIEDYRGKFSNPYIAASRGYVDEVIEPSVTRPRIISALDLLRTKRDNRPSKKHGNIPL